MAAEGDDGSVKLEVEVKREPVECVVCGNRGTHTADVTSSTTTSGTALLSFFHRYTQQDLSTASSKHICKSCHDLINVLEQAELEYLKLKETFEAIINKNPLFHTQAQNPQPVGLVKVEIDEYNNEDVCDNNESDEEPLAIVKKKRPRKAIKSKKKVVSPTKRRGRPRNSDKWSCDRCGERGTGGAEQAAAHMWTTHTEMITDLPPVPELKKENSVDGGVEENIVRDSHCTQENGSSEDYHFNNGVDASIPLEEGFADDSSDYLPSAYSDEESKGSQEKMKILNKTRKKREPKTWHHCDQCNAKYSNIKRLEMHREKHSEGKPPFICEVCGARYKHKRACDIHVALHKGISDWKCEECNKLFPSKGALQRHNNIHTGKLNYQCDLCGKSFIHTSSFKMHKLSHSGVKPHSCDVCGLALMTRSHLKRHKRVHSGEKRHECLLCGKRFSERYNLVAHSRAHEAPGAPPALPPQPRRRLFRCAFCVERFERRYMLERHMSVVHGRTLERAPPTPRNTMSKLLKAQAQRHPQPASLPDTHSNTPEAEAKEERSPESRAASAGLPQKIHLSDAGGAAAAWAEWRQHYAQ